MVRAMTGGQLRGGVAQGAIVHMRVNRRGLALAVAEQSADSGEPHAVHHALRGPGVTEVVDTEARQPGLIADNYPERVEPG